MVYMCKLDWSDLGGDIFVIIDYIIFLFVLVKIGGKKLKKYNFICILMWCFGLFLYNVWFYGCLSVLKDWEVFVGKLFFMDFKNI